MQMSLDGHHQSCAPPLCCIWHDLGSSSRCLTSLAFCRSQAQKNDNGGRLVFQPLETDKSGSGPGLQLAGEDGGHIRGVTAQVHLGCWVISCLSAPCPGVMRRGRAAARKRAFAPPGTLRKDATPLSFHGRGDLAAPIGYRHDPEETLAPAHFVQEFRRRPPLRPSSASD